MIRFAFVFISIYLAGYGAYSQATKADTLADITKKAYTKGDIDKLVQENKILFLDFSAVWCGPCKKMAPIIDEIEKENPAKIKIVRLDYDVNRKLANSMNIYEIPYVQIYVKGKLLENIIGIMEKKVILDLLPKD